MAEPAPPLPEGLPETLQAEAEQIQALTEEMVAGAEADDWGRVTAAEQERRPLISELVQAGFQEEGGVMAEEWLRWLLETNEVLVARGHEIRSAMLEERLEENQRSRAVRLYQHHQDESKR